MQAVTLTEFLLARIAEDEALLPEWFRGTGGQWRPILRIKAECEAKRRIVAECASRIESGDGVTSGAQLGQGVLSLLSLPYADHPDYREEWRA